MVEKRSQNEKGHLSHSGTCRGGRRINGFKWREETIMQELAGIQRKIEGIEKGRSRRVR